MARRLTNHVKRHEPAYQIAGVCIAIVISIVSLFYSCQANWNAKQTSRPYISMDVIPENGRYLRATVEGTNYVLSYSLKVKNSGLTPALNIQFSDHISEPKLDGSMVDTPLQEPVSFISLATGEENTINGGFRFPVAGNPVDLVSRVESGAFHVEMQIVVEYEGPLAGHDKYFTGLACDVHHGYRLLKGSSMT